MPHGERRTAAAEAGAVQPDGHGQDTHGPPDGGRRRGARTAAPRWPHHRVDLRQHRSGPRRGRRRTRLHLHGRWSTTTRPATSCAPCGPWAWNSSTSPDAGDDDLATAAREELAEKMAAETDNAYFTEQHQQPGQRGRRHPVAHEVERRPRRPCRRAHRCRGHRRRAVRHRPRAAPDRARCCGSSGSSRGGVHRVRTAPAHDYHQFGHRQPGRHHRRHGRLRPAGRGREGRRRGGVRHRAGRRA
ncbi:hypothetical protein LT493_17805 [Streptomyces tricolor]|nr:hypothetical protein [Streptomyces tricolor]